MGIQENTAEPVIVGLHVSMALFTLRTTIETRNSFPIGTLALSAQELGRDMDMVGMKVVSVILMMLLVVIWVFLFPTTVYYGVIKDTWFASPCLAEVGGSPPTLDDVVFNNRKY